MNRLANSALDLAGRAEVGRGEAEGLGAARPSGQRERWMAHHELEYGEP